jgi:hypothetical protein
MKLKSKPTRIIVLLLLFLIVLQLPEAFSQISDSWANAQVISFDGEHIVLTMSVHVKGNHVDDAMWVQTESDQSHAVAIVVSRGLSEKAFDQGTNMTVFSYSYAYNFSSYRCDPKVWGYVLFPYDKHTVTLTLSSNFAFNLDQHPTNCIVLSQNYEGSFQAFASTDPSVYNIVLEVHHSQSFENGYAWFLFPMVCSLYIMSVFLFLILFKRRKTVEKMGGDLITVSLAIMFFVPVFEIAFNAVKAPLPLVFSDILLIPIVPINAILIILALIFKARAIKI